jgi:hypothetical protein
VPPCKQREEHHRQVGSCGPYEVRASHREGL